MAVGIVQDGKLVSGNEESKLESLNKLNKTGLDKDAFLGLLVAQMKYQDPLQPTSNTEFISQYATFSELEQMQNMSSAMELSRASSLVGQIVSVNTTDSKGNPVQLQGKVDYVLYENNKAYVSIQENKYPLDNVYAVANKEYLDALDMGMEFAVGMNKLPKKEDLTLEDKKALDKLNEMYKNMNDYQKTFVASDYVTKLKEYTVRMDEMVKDHETAEFIDGMKKLPKLEELSLGNKEALDNLNKAYEGMDEEQKNDIGSSYAEQLKAYMARMEELSKESSS